MHALKRTCFLGARGDRAGHALSPAHTRPSGPCAWPTCRSTPPASATSQVRSLFLVAPPCALRNEERTGARPWQGLSSGQWTAPHVGGASSLQAASSDRASKPVRAAAMGTGAAVAPGEAEAIPC